MTRIGDRAVQTKQRDVTITWRGRRPVAGSTRHVCVGCYCSPVCKPQQDMTCHTTKASCLYVGFRVSSGFDDNSNRNCLDPDLSEHASPTFRKSLSRIASVNVKALRASCADRKPISFLVLDLILSLSLSLSLLHTLQ